MRFSQKMGHRPVKTVLQVESIDDDLKNRLWNIVAEYFNVIEVSTKSRILKIIWGNFYKLTLDSRPRNSFSFEIDDRATIAYIREWFFGAQWFDIYDFIEFLVEYDEKLDGAFNYILQKEVSGYRIINGQVTQITSEGEIAEIQEAITSSDQWKSVNTHLNV